MNDFIDIYCERLGPGLWAEPVNAVTNLAFFIAAFCAYRLAKQQNALSVQSLTLIITIAIIGAGSSAFHTFATFWAMLSDSLPILIYQIFFLLFYAHSIIRLKFVGQGILLMAFFGSIYLFAQLPENWLNGSLQYAPALLFVAGLGVYHLLTAQREKYILLIAALVFTISLTFRSLDMQLCESLPLGTHFFWHCLNGLVLYLTARSLIINTHRS